MGQSYEGYELSCNQLIKLGQPFDFTIRVDFTTLEWVMRDFHPRRLYMNAPCPRFIVIHSVSVDGTLLAPFYQKDGKDSPKYDAFVFSPNEENNTRELNSPLCKHGVLICGTYTGFIPDQYKSVSEIEEYRFPFTVTLAGRLLNADTPKV